MLQSLRPKVIDRVRLMGCRGAGLQILRALVRQLDWVNGDIVFVVPHFQASSFEDPVIKLIARETVEKASVPGDVAPADVAVLTRCLDKGSRGICAEAEGRLAGYAWVQHSGEYRFGRAGCITICPELTILEKLLVFPEFRLRKLGRKLNAAHLAMISAGRRPAVFIIPQNRYAIRNWEEDGFQRVAQVNERRWIGGSWEMKIARLRDVPEAEPILQALTESHQR